MLFQMMFAATATTIVSGAMAERVHFSAYLIGACVISGLIYPIFGSWAWGGYGGGDGWLKALGFVDFAGSTVAFHRRVVRLGRDHGSRTAFRTVWPERRTTPRSWT